MTWAEVKTSKPCDGKCGYEDYLEFLDQMLDNEEYEFAFDTLESMEKWIKQSKHITDAQKKAIRNIKNHSRGVALMEDEWSTD